MGRGLIPHPVPFEDRPVFRGYRLHKHLSPFLPRRIQPLGSLRPRSVGAVTVIFGHDDPESHRQESGQPHCPAGTKSIKQFQLALSSSQAAMLTLACGYIVINAELMQNIKIHDQTLRSLAQITKNWSFRQAQKALTLSWLQCHMCPAARADLQRRLLDGRSRCCAHAYLANRASALFGRWTENKRLFKRGNLARFWRYCSVTTVTS